MLFWCWPLCACVYVSLFARGRGYFFAGVLIAGQSITFVCCIWLGKQTGDVHASGGFNLMPLAVQVEPQSTSPTLTQCISFIGPYLIVYREPITCCPPRKIDGESTRRKALAMRIEVLGPDHPCVGLSASNLAGVLRDQGMVTDIRI